MTLNYDTTYLYRMPTKLYYGFGSIRSTAAEVRSLGATKVMLITDPGIVAAGLVGPVEDNLRENNIPYELFSDIEVDPGNAVCVRGAAFLKEHGCDAMVVIGGGSPLCAAKGMAILATNGGDVRDYKGADKVKKPCTPIIAIPTTAGAGSEVSAATVLHDEEKGRATFTINSIHLFPVAAILDPLVLRGLPLRPFLFAAVDALTHAVESLYTIYGTPLTDALAYEAIRLMAENLPRAAHCDDLEAKGLQQLASVMANMACGNAKLGLVHGAGGPINAMYHIPHGMALGIMLPHVMQYNLPVAREKFARLSDLCGWSKPDMTLDERAQASVDGITALLELIEAPNKIPAETVPHADIEKLVDRSMTYAFTNTLNKRHPSREDVRALYEKAFIGWGKRVE